MSPPVKPGNGELSICFPSELNLHFGSGISQLSMFDYRSIATGFHQPLPFLAPRYSQRFHVPDRACGAGRSEDNALPNTTVPGKMKHMLTALIVRLESIISTQICYSPLGCYWCGVYHFAIQGHHYVTSNNSCKPLEPTHLLAIVANWEGAPF